MKVLRISDELHQQLKRDAQANGRTLQWWVENLLGNKEGVFTNPVPWEPAKVEDDKIVPRTRTKGEILQEIDKLEALEKEELEYCQDPEVADAIKKKYDRQQLWNEYYAIGL